MEELGRLDIQDGCELADDFEAHITDSSFHAAQVGTVDLSVISTTESSG